VPIKNASAMRTKHWELRAAAYPSRRSYCNTCNNSRYNYKNYSLNKNAVRHAANICRIYHPYYNDHYYCYQSTDAYCYCHHFMSFLISGSNQLLLLKLAIINKINECSQSNREQFSVTKSRFVIKLHVYS
jgi:hypothetical protein